MASCEHCWGMAYRMSMDNDKSQAENYSVLIDKNNCTPEQQAGDGAGICPLCRRKTVHVYCKVCMVVGCDHKEDC